MSEEGHTWAFGEKKKMKKIWNHNHQFPPLAGQNPNYTSNTKANKSHRKDLKQKKWLLLMIIENNSKGRQKCKKITCSKVYPYSFKRTNINLLNEK